MKIFYVQKKITSYILLDVYLKIILCIRLTSNLQNKKVFSLVLRNELFATECHNKCMRDFMLYQRNTNN